MKLTILFFLFRIFGIELSTEGIITIIALLVAIVLGIIPIIQTKKQVKKKYKLSQEAMFKKTGWIHSSQLNYSFLDYLRVMKDDRNPSSQSGISELIRKILDERKEQEEQNHILLVGPSLSGKSHITVSILRNLPNAFVLLPNESNFNEAESNGYVLPDAPLSAQYKIVLLDNFHEFFKGSGISPKAFMNKAIEKGLTIWANCISIEEYSRVKSLLDFKVGNRGIFKEIELNQKLPIDEAEAISQSFEKEKLPILFNGLIGEIFYPPADMMQHYENLKSDVIAFDVLLFIKQAYLLGAFTLPYLMKLELIKKAFTKKYSNDFIPLMMALKKIESKGFIKLQSDHVYFSFDSVWLNEIVEPEIKVKDFFTYWNDIVYKNIVYYTNLMTSSKNYSDALLYYEEMQAEEIIPNLRTYTTLISLSPNYETALKWFDKIEKGKANEFTYTSLISQSPDYETALKWFDKIEIGKVNEYTYTSLISQSPDYETALKWFDKTEKDKVTFITYNSLITRSPNYEIALKWFYKIGRDKANFITYNALISRSPDYKTALEWFKINGEAKAQISTYNAIINFSPNYETALEWFSKIKGTPDVITYNSLINHSPNYKTALEWYAKIDEGKATVITYSTLITKSPNYETALQWFGEIETGKATAITYNILISLSPDYETALDWFSKIEEETVTVDTYNTLISLSPDYETALVWFTKIRKGTADTYTYNSLISKTHDVDIGMKWLRKMEEEKIKIDDYTYGALIKAASWSKKIDKYQLAISLHDEMLKKSIKSNVIIFTLLISLSPSFEQGVKLLELMITEKDKYGNLIIPNDRTRKALERKAFNDPELLKIVDAWFIK